MPCKKWFDTIVDYFNCTVSLSNQKDNQDYQEIQDILRSAKIDE
jgi:hypothetical protein